MQQAALKFSRITRLRIADGRFSVQAFGPYLDGIVEHRSGPAVVLTMGRISDCSPSNCPCPCHFETLSARASAMSEPSSRRFETTVNGPDQPASRGLPSSDFRPECAPAMTEYRE